MPDRIEASTLMIAVAALGCGANRGPSRRRFDRRDRSATKTRRRDFLGGGWPIGTDQHGIEAASVICKYTALSGLATDVQPLLGVLAAMANGESRIVDEVFPARKSHLPDLRRMGAHIDELSNGARYVGAASLHPSRLRAFDLRGAAALVVAALAANGRSTVVGLEHLDRGYDRLEEKLRLLGANIKRVELAPTLSPIAHHDALSASTTSF